MLDLNVISNYLVVGVVLGCCGIGYVIKKSLDFIPNKYIPLIMAILGVILNVAISKQFDMNVFLFRHHTTFVLTMREIDILFFDDFMRF